ncbi:MAG TPA: type III secretion system inner membrane ring subunit SctD [Chlamydiales bacterium]|nr:type III secretion system inner membrane ring subunit SctD [Chlamydiales bacterium]
MTAHLIAEDGPKPGQVLNLSIGDEWIIGRSSDVADLIIDDSTVSRKHAKLHKTKDGIFIKNFSKVNPTLVNMEEVRGNVLLKEGDRIQIGETTFLFSEQDISKNKKTQSNYDDIFAELNVPEEAPFDGTMEETVQAKGQSQEDSSYDTVFEDVSESGQVPFNLPSDTPYLLKVVSGPNAGAEIGMEKGHVYTLGKDPKTCDILFQDLSVSRSHARVTITEDGVIEIEDLGSRNGTAVNGTPITEKHIVTPQDLLSLGTTVFLIIDRYAPQETIDASILSHTTPEVPIVADVTAPSEDKDWKKEPIPFKHLMIGGSVLVIFFIAFVTFFSLFKTKGIEIVHKEPTSEIKEALSAEKFSGVEFSLNRATGKLFLVGHILTNVDYQEMRYALHALAYITSIDDAVVIDEGVSKMMNELFSTHPEWMSINVRAIQPGRFVVIGYLQTAKELTDLSDFVTQNFPYLDRLQNNVVVEEILSSEIQSLITQSGLSAVTYQLSNGELMLTGVYNEKKKKEFEEFIDALRKRRSILSIKNFAIPTDERRAAIDLSAHYSVNGVTLFDSMGINAVINGKMYLLKDELNGMEITKIEEKTILLEKDGVKYRIDFSP